MPEKPSAQVQSINPKRIRQMGLALLAASALYIASQGLQTDTGPDRPITLLAGALGVASVLLRRLSQRPGLSNPTFIKLAAAALVSAAALGPLGAWTANHSDAGQTGLLFVVAGVLFSIRPFHRSASS